MNSKTFTLTAFSILALVLVLGFANAVVDISTTSSATVTVNPGETVNFNLELQATVFGDDIENATLILPNLFGSSTSWSGDIGLFTLLNHSNQTKSVSIVVPSNQTLGTYTGQISLDGDYTGAAMPVINNLSVTIIVSAPPVTYTFCKPDTINDTDLTLNVKIDNKGAGKDYQWLPLDIIEVEVELKNDKSNVDLSDVVLELGLFKEGSTSNIADDMVWISEENEEYQLGDVDENERSKHIFEFQIDPNEVNSGNYILMVKAYPNGDENEVCIDHSIDLAEDNFGVSEYYATIDVNKESDRDKMVVVDEDSVGILSASCNQEIAFTADVWNIGNKDFQDQIMVSLYNQELGFDLKKVILGDLDEGDNTEVSFAFKVPSNATEKTYSLYLQTYYDYDESSGSYEVDYDRRSDDSFVVYLTVSGNCAIVHSTSPVISAILESEAKAGQDLVVRALVTNPGDSIITYVINAAGYAEWATTAVLSQNSFTLGPGETEEVLITLSVKEDATEGTKLFNIELVSEGLYIDTQAVEVYIEGKSGFNFTGPVAYAYALGLLSIILLVVIIIVSIRLARK